VLQAEDVLSWLLEPAAPGVCFLALRDLCDLPPNHLDLEAARDRAYQEGPIAAVLAEMHPEGYWVEPGPGYRPKYRSSVWSLILLAQLGAKAGRDERIAHACAYLLDHALTANGQFSISGTPSTTVDCLQGNLCATFLDLGYDDPRLERAWEWMARTVTGEGIAPMEEKDVPLRYYSGKCGPNFACGANNRQPCAWGAVKVMLALSKLPADRRTPLIERAIDRGVAFLLGVDPATAAYPTRENTNPSSNWWKFGFPVFYVTDLLQNVEALVRLGYGADPRLDAALQLIRDKQDANGRWALEYSYAGKTWGDFGAKKQPSKWVTWRALQVLNLIDRTNSCS
jgi:hypothetical protein